MLVCVVTELKEPFSSCAVYGLLLLVSVHKDQCQVSGHAGEQPNDADDDYAQGKLTPISQSVGEPVCIELLLLQEDVRVLVCLHDEESFNEPSRIGKPGHKAEV